jgi:hypothetical protein
MSSLSIHVIYVALVGSGIQVTVCACMCLSRGTQNLFVVIDQVFFLVCNSSIPDNQDSFKWRHGLSRSLILGERSGWMFRLFFLLACRREREEYFY